MVTFTIASPPDPSSSGADYEQLYKQYLETCANVFSGSGLLRVVVDPGCFGCGGGSCYGVSRSACVGHGICAARLGARLPDLSYEGATLGSGHDSAEGASSCGARPCFDGGDGKHGCSGLSGPGSVGAGSGTSGSGEGRGGPGVEVPEWRVNSHPVTGGQDSGAGFIGKNSGHNGSSEGAGDSGSASGCVSPGSKGCLPGETTKQRNQRWKAEKKEKKARRNLGRMSAEISKGPKAVERMVVERRGYFSDCPEDVQQELRNTRAALLIAQNKKELAIAERKQRMLTSDVTLVRDVLNVVKLQEQVEKVTKRKNEIRVGGWAQTVLTASSSEMVDKAASKPNSSIPTLSSVSLGDCVDTNQKEKRELQYKLALAEIEANIGEIGLQYEEEIEQARAKVKEEFSDVAYPDELRFKREFIAAMARDMTLAERARLFTLAEDQGIDLDGLQY